MKAHLGFLLLFSIILVHSTIGENLQNCLNDFKNGDQDSIKLLCTNINTLELKMGGIEELYTKAIIDVIFLKFNMKEISSLGYLMNLKNMVRLTIENDNNISIVNTHLFQNTSLKEINIQKVESGMQNKLIGNWLIYTEGNNMWLKTCENTLEQYNSPFYEVVRGTTDNLQAVAVREDNDQLPDNYEECVRLFCRNPQKKFTCSDLNKFYNIKPVKSKYNKCLAEVTFLKIPPLVPELLTRSLDQFSSVVKIKFDGTFQTVLEPCVFYNLKNLRFIDFDKLGITREKVITFMSTYRNVLLVSHSLFRIYSECDRLRFIDTKTSTTSILQFKDSNCSSYLKIIFIIIGLMSFFSIFVVVVFVLYKFKVFSHCR